MVVRMRHTKSHTKNRRSHHALSARMFVKCENCKELKRSHMVCVACGFYKGIKVIDMVRKAERKQKREKAKAAETR